MTLSGGWHSESDSKKEIRDPRAKQAYSTRRRPGRSAHGSTEFIVVDGVRVATRNFGAGEPLVLLNRVRGTMDEIRRS